MIRQDKSDALNNKKKNIKENKAESYKWLKTLFSSFSYNFCLECKELMDWFFSEQCICG